jgi:hypothetical protein
MWLRFIIVMLLLNWGFIREQNTMSTCVQISEAVADELGRPELVVDWNGADYTPTARFLRMINRAHRDLDRMYKHDFPMEVFDLALAQGEWKLALPDGVRYIHRIDLEDSAGNLVPQGGLKLRDLGWLRDLYGELFDQVGEGQPLYWARAVGDYAVDPVDAVEGIVDTDEDYATWTGPPVEPPDEWFSLNDTFSYDGGAKWDGVSAAAFLGYQFPEPQQVFVSECTISFENTGGGTWMFTIGTDDEIVDSATGTDDGEQSVTLYGGDEVIPGLGISYANIDIQPGDAFLVTSITYKFSVEAPVSAGVETDIITMPPADQAYTAHVYASVYAEAMVSNTDVTWWSDKYPEILELAIKRRVALDLNRNKTEIRDYDEDIERAVLDLEIDAAHEDQHSASETERRFGSYP